MIRRFDVCAALVLMAALGGAACRHPKPVVPAPPPPAAPAPPVAKPEPPPPPPPAPAPAQPAAPTEDEIFRNKTLAQLNEEKPLGDVLFAYDSTDLSDAARTILQKDVDWMKKWPTTKVMVEGHADSRGTTEYNLALGDQRARVAKEYLEHLGVPAREIATVSYGAQRPRVPGHDDAAHAQNRRDDLIVR